MARLKTLQAAIKARIEEIPELAKSAIIFKSADIESQFKARMNKVSGRAVILRVTAGKNQASGRKSAYELTATISLFMVPTLKPGKDCETLLAELDAHLSGWWPATVASNHAAYLRAESISFPESQEYDIGVLVIKTPPMHLI